jgi:hypothetical protein
MGARQAKAVLAVCIGAGGLQMLRNALWRPGRHAAYEKGCQGEWQSCPGSARLQAEPWTLPVRRTLRLPHWGADAWGSCSIWIGGRPPGGCWRHACLQRVLRVRGMAENDRVSQPKPPSWRRTRRLSRRAVRSREAAVAASGLRAASSSATQGVQRLLDARLLEGAARRRMRRRNTPAASRQRRGRLPHHMVSWKVREMTSSCWSRVRVVKCTA